MTDSEPTRQTPYERFGGAPFFESLVHAFYVRVKNDPVLLPMYPEDELDAAERRLRMFLEQYWGGPDTYGQERGHPMLRARHMPFPVNSEARDHWLANMHEAISEQNMSVEDENELWMYLIRAAFAMQNIDDPMPGGATAQPITQPGHNAGGSE